MPQRELIIVGGPNGAGKTTFALEDMARRGGIYLSADAIAAELSPSAPADFAVQAGRRFIGQFNQLIQAEDRLIVESTLAGKTMLRMVTAARKYGVCVKLRFIFVDSEEISLNRVRQRVKLGGHNVPEDDVRRRFGRSIVNFWTSYRSLADDWLLVYNQGGVPERVVSGFNDARFVYDEALYSKFLQLVHRYGS